MLTKLFCHASFSFSQLLTYTFLIPTVITETFIVVAEITIPTGTPTTEAKAEIETYPVIPEARISKCSV